MRIEQLASSVQLRHPPDDEAARWLQGLDEVMHARLVAVKLATPRQGDAATALAPFFDAYIASRTDTKPRTIINLKQARSDVVKFFGEAKDLREVSEGDVEEFWRWMLRDEEAEGRGLATNTARRICGRAKQLFLFAIRKRLVQANPFAGMKCQVQGNAEREFFITRDMAARCSTAASSSP